MSTIEEIHSEREKKDQEYQELCERLTQEQDEKEIIHIQNLIKLNRYNEEELKHKEFREKLLNVKNNKERNELINSYVEETKAETEKIKELRKQTKLEMEEKMRKELEERRKKTAERRRLAEEKKKQ